MQFFESFWRLFRYWKRVLVRIGLRTFSRPRENLLAIICVLLILSFNWLQGETSRLLFEIEIFNLSATWLFYFTPVLLFFNSFLFQRTWVKMVSAIASPCSICINIFSILFQMVYWQPSTINPKIIHLRCTNYQHLREI